MLKDEWDALHDGSLEPTDDELSEITESEVEDFSSEDLEFFTIGFTGFMALGIHDIWPDGDAPENPMAEDVLEVLEESGDKLSVLDEWGLMDALEVTVDGYVVWD